MSYSTFVEVDGSGGQAPYLIIQVDTDGDTGIEDLLFFEPLYQSAAFFPSNPQGPLTTDTWQTWDALAGGWYSVFGTNGSGPGANVQAWSTLVAALPPGAQIFNSSSGLGGVRIVTGFGAGAWDNFLGAADNFTIGVSGTNTTYDFEPAAATLVTVTIPTPDGFTFQVVDDDSDTVTTGTFDIVSGPGTPPLGDGSLEFDLGTEGEDGVQARNNLYDGQFIRDMDALSYSTYVQQPGSGGQAPYIILDVDTNNDGVRDDLWFFEPVYQTAGFCPSNSQPAIVTGAWQTWEALNGCWYSLFGLAGSGPGVNVVPLATLLAAEDDARLSTNIAGGSFRIVTGFGDIAWDNFIGNADALTISFLGNTTTYDFEPVPTIIIDDVSMFEGNAGTTNFVFTLTLSEAVSQTVTVDYTTADNTALAADSDYTPVLVAQTATFNPNTTTTTITIGVTGDTKFEPDEAFFVNLTNPQFATIADPQGLGTIQNDDLQPTIIIDDVAMAEGNAGTTNFIFTVSLSNASSQTITVNFTTNGISATEGIDYADNTGMLTFVPNDTSETITVAVTGETIFEADETFTVDLSGPVNATILDPQGLGTIQNDDGQPTISIDDVSLNEGNAGTINFVFTVTLSNPSDQTVTVNYTTNPGSASEPGDYADSTGTLTFVPLDTSETITVLVNGDTTNEGDETFTVDLSGATNATIFDNQGLGTILNDDGPPTISIDDVSLAEGNAGTTNFVFTVTLSNPSDQPITVNFTTNPGTATEGNDYADNTGMLTFVALDTSETITVLVTGDTTFEGNETFTVDLYGATNATILDNQGLGTILEDDVNEADLSISKIGPATTPRYQNVTYTITVNNAGPQTASNVEVTDILPAGATFVSATPSQGGPCTGTGPVVCNLGAIAAGGSATITLVITPPQSGSTFTNTASVVNLGTEVDPTPGNNAGTSFTAISSSDIPTLSEWALLMLIAALMGFAVIKLR